MILPFRGESPRIAENVFIAPTAAVVGRVTLARDSSVWFGAVLRGDAGEITVGAGSNIQDNATLHCDPGHSLRIGENVTVGHNATVHCDAVGDDTLVGMGARLLSGAVIGKHCVIAAGAVVLENAVVPDGTLMAGVPARAVKALSPEAVEALGQRNHYVALAREYLK